MRTSSNRHGILVVLSIALAAGAGTLLLLGLPSNDAVSKESGSSVSIFKDKDSMIRADEMPEKSLALAGMVTRSTEFSDSSPVAVAKLDGGRDAFLFEAGGKICLMFEGGPGTCALPESVARGEMYSVTPNTCDEIDIVGVMPDGVDSFVVTGEGADTRVDVVDNVYQATLPAVGSRIVASDLKDQSLPLGWYASQSSSCQK